MGYQALLFCPDEKLARIVVQVFSELDFSMESVQEPFSAVKKLMAQRYDSLVVDCENDSNASLLFKSARNSSANQGTLVIALVEGQAGVAKAYRIGANLVLTKPINVEQAKGTLRVARGLLRKNSDIASAALASTASPGAAPSPPAPTPAPAAPVAAASLGVTQPKPVALVETPAAPATRVAPPSAPPKVARAAPEFEPAVPAAAASVAVPEAPAVPVPAPETPARSAAAAKVPVPPVPALERVKPAASTPSASPDAVSAQGAAAAPAKAREAAPARKDVPEFEPAEHSHPVAASHDSAIVGSSPTFSALEPEATGDSGRNKKIMIAAAVLVAVAVLGYFGWTSLHSHKSAKPAPVSAPQQPSGPPPEMVPMSVPATTAPATDRAAAGNSLMSTSKVIAAAGPEKTSGSLILRLESTPPQPAKAPAVAPMVVKTTPGKPKTSSEEAAALVPNPLAVGAANESALNSVVATTAATSGHPTLATLKISQGVSQGLLIKRVDPKYPQSALAMHIQGAVVLDATINREGNIVNLTVAKGEPTLARAALDAVRQWRYKPYYLDGEPVEIQTQITINFKLPN